METLRVIWCCLDVTCWQVLFRTIPKEEEEALRARFAGSQADRASAAPSTGASTGASAASSAQSSASSSKVHGKGEPFAP